MEATGKAHVEENNRMHDTMPPAATYVCITNIRPVSGLMVCIINKQTHDSSPSHEHNHSQWSNKSHQSPLRGQRWIHHEWSTSFPIILIQKNFSGKEAPDVENSKNNLILHDK